MLWHSLSAVTGSCDVGLQRSESARSTIYDVLRDVEKTADSPRNFATIRFVINRSPIEFTRDAACGSEPRPTIRNHHGGAGSEALKHVVLRFRTQYSEDKFLGD